VKAQVRLGQSPNTIIELIIYYAENSPARRFIARLDHFFNAFFRHHGAQTRSRVREWLVSLARR
jgi:hypothetical protein